MADNRHSGMQTTMAITVTHSEPTINGLKPNCPSEGDQSVDVIRLKNLWFFKSGYDFNTSPVPIANGSNKHINRHNCIHFEEIISLIFLEVCIKLLLYTKLFGGKLFLLVCRYCVCKWHITRRVNKLLPICQHPFKKIEDLFLLGFTFCKKV